MIKKSKSPKNKAEDLSKEINSKGAEKAHPSLSLFPHISHSYIHIFTNYVCFIHDDRRAASCHRRKIGRVQRNVDRGAEQERAIGTRALIVSIFLLSHFSARFRRGGAMIPCISALCALFEDSLSRVLRAFTRTVFYAERVHISFVNAFLSRELARSRSRARMRFSRRRLVID